MAVSKLVGAKVIYDRGAVLHLMYANEMPTDIRLTAAQLQVLALDAVAVLLSYYGVRERDGAGR